MRVFCITAVAVISFLSACGTSTPSGSGPIVGPGVDAGEIHVLSNRPDLINGGDALIEIIPANSKTTFAVALNGHDTTPAFKQLADGRIVGLVSDLALGANTVSAEIGGATSSITIVNHPNGGPVIAGPQNLPWQCEDGALDAQCNKPAELTWFYMPTGSNQDFQPYDPQNPPSDVASTTTDTGVTVPYIVRVETGYQDRDQYKIAVLFQPDQDWTAAQPQEQFNHKLVITHGASCDVDYATGGAPSVISYNPADLLGLPVNPPFTVFADSMKYALGAGFAVLSTALDNNGHDCDVVIQAESLLMAKEHLIEQYGTLRYTIGTGCSGGSLAQQWIANAYPGIYQGILPTCSFPDTWSSATQVMDYHLLRAYFEHPNTWGTGVLWTPDQWADVEGNLLPVDAIISDIGFFNAIVPTHGCGGISDEQRYDPVNNPTGVRCSIADMAVSVFGVREPSVWSAVEQQLGHGFAGVPVDNVGVQYGLGALQSLQITPDQFVDLNAKIGGLSIDIVPTPERIAADHPALANAYRSGMINVGNNLDQTAIIDCRGPDPGAAHDSYRAFAVRERLDREHGNHDNQLIWEGPAPIVGDTQCNLTSLIAMDQWLAAIENDTASRPIAQKIVNDKPAGLSDQCWDGLGDKVLDALCGEAIVPVYGTPRTVAGDALTTDTNKCQLKPIDPNDYGLLGVALSGAQLATLAQIFPDGVCDYSKPAVDFGPTVAWLTYQDAAGMVLTGGQPLPALPLAEGWVSPAFR